MESGSSKDMGASRHWPVLLPLIAGLCLLLHPYRGLVHDARIYALQALNVMEPGIYGQDVYLRYGSQDTYTFFSPVFAALASMFGIEHSAALIVLASVAAILTAAWFLARTFMPSGLAWLAMGALVIAPGFYGPDQHFEILEGFATPRLPAEALVLAALATWLAGRRLLAAVMLLAGMVLHPIMSFCGVALLFIFWFSQQGKTTAMWSLLLLVVASIIGSLLPLDSWQFDSNWWPMVSRESLLLLGEWSSADWARISTVMTTLIYSAIVLDGTARRFACSAIAACCLALLLSWIGGDLLKVIIVIQSQPWRMLWLATAVAVLLSPAMVLKCWTGPALRRAGILLLLAAWLAGHQQLAWMLSVPALVLVMIPDIRLPAWGERVAPATGAIALGVAALCVLAVTTPALLPDARPTEVPTWRIYAAVLRSNWVIPIALLVGFWILARQAHGAGRTAIAVIATLLMVPVASATTRPWITETYPETLRNSFSTWREQIPPGNEVLWARELIPGSDPSAVWLLLERPSYYSSVQVNSALFSRPAALELNRRYKSIPAMLQVEQSLEIKFDMNDQFRVDCHDLPVRHIVTDTPIAGARLVPAPPDAPEPFRRLKLQICPEP